ncbi:LacI family DNA-binding transcriptional regulator [Streptomyces phaeochromogenes]|uniref:LacI family DNA-binding transcriptional regulator n=1 Tax=Streptomyces phaeochromogenes TaxID=1923 RepID=UPI00340C4D02
MIASACTFARHTAGGRPERSGVSLVTASKVVHRRRDVSEATRVRIEAALAEHGYVRAWEADAHRPSVDGAATMAETEVRDLRQIGNPVRRLARRRHLPICMGPGRLRRCSSNGARARRPSACRSAVEDEPGVWSYVGRSVYFGVGRSPCSSEETTVFDDGVAVPGVRVGDQTGIVPPRGPASRRAGGPGGRARTGPACRGKSGPVGYVGHRCR